MRVSEEQWHEQVTESVNTLIDEVEKIKRFQVACEQDKSIAMLMQLNEKQMSHATNYTNLILVAGYAGFFGFWTTLSGRLPGKVYALTGLLALLSLILFIGWEVVKMVWTNVHLRHTNTILTDPKTKGKHAQLWEASTALYSVNVHRVWLCFLVPTLITGLGAGTLLLGCFGVQLWQAFAS
jgi:hypothetical protein